MIPMMMGRAWETLLVFVVFVHSKMVIGTKIPNHSSRQSDASSADPPSNHCLSWRLAVETNNIKGWRTVPTQCLRHVENYMTGGQYDYDVNLIADEISNYADQIELSDDGMDAWILDVDDTCISNLVYYKGKRFGGDPYDPEAFKAWASSGRCRAIPGIRRLFQKLVASGFKVFLVTGRDQQTLERPTIHNLHLQGFFGYERLILRTEGYKGQSAIMYKTEMRKKVMEEGYRIWGNVGDQWSDIEGQFIGNRIFKLPNPMYFVP